MKYGILFLLCSLLVACVPAREKSVEVIFTLLEADTFKTGDFFHTARLITLQKSDLSEISHVCLYDSLVIVKGKTADAEIHLFDISGEYICPVLNTDLRGDDPLNVQQIRVDEKNRLLEILCDDGTKLVRYSLIGLKIMEVIHLPLGQVYLTDFRKVNDRYYFFCSSADHAHFYVYDKIEGLMSCFNRTEQFQYSLFKSKLSDIFDQNRQFGDLFQAEGYLWKGKKCKIYLNLSSKDTLTSEESNIPFEKDAFKLKWCFEYQNRLFSSFCYENSLYWSVVDWKSGKAALYVQVMENLLKPHNYFQPAVLKYLGNGEHYIFYGLPESFFPEDDGRITLFLFT